MLVRFLQLERGSLIRRSIAMIDGNKLWSCVGSAGIVNPADIGKVVFTGPVAQMPGVVVAPPQAAERAVVRPQTKAVIRYPVTPVDGVALQSNPIERYVLRVLARLGRGGIHVRFLEVPIVTGPTPEIGETALFDFPIQNAHAGFNLTNFSNVSAGELNFVNNCHYVEITLSESIGPVALDPPGIALIQLVHTTNF
jgi:hypothetical protein